LAADLGDDTRALQGTWISESFEAKGAQKNSRSVTLTFEGERLLMKIDGNSFDLGYELDVESVPKRLDIINKRTRIDGSQNLGIYKLDGDRLTICHGGSARPDKFEIRTEEFSLDTLIVLKRKR
jgi:uncharacterized protein (TIGR03067 family)